MEYDYFSLLPHWNPNLNTNQLVKINMCVFVGVGVTPINFVNAQLWMSANISLALQDAAVCISRYQSYA